MRTEALFAQTHVHIHEITACLTKFSKVSYKVYMQCKTKCSKVLGVYAVQSHAYTAIYYLRYRVLSRDTILEECNASLAHGEEHGAHCAVIAVFAF